MILADTSVVIDHVKGRDAKLIALIPTLTVVVCGISRADLWTGLDPRIALGLGRG